MDSKEAFSELLYSDEYKKVAKLLKVTPTYLVSLRSLHRNGKIGIASMEKYLLRGGYIKKERWIK